MKLSIQFRLVIGMSLVIVLSFLFSLVVTGMAIRVSLKDQGSAELLGATEDISQTFDGYLNLLGDQIQAATTDPVLRSKLLDLAPKDQPPGLEPEVDERNLAQANRYFQSNQPALFARQALFAVADSSRRLVYISSRPDRFGPLAFPGLLLQADSQGVGVALPRAQEIQALAGLPDLLDKSSEGLIYFAVPIFSAERKIGYLVLGNPIQPMMKTWDQRLKIKSSVKIGSEYYFPAALEGPAEQVFATGRLRGGEVQVARDLGVQTAHLVSRVREMLIWSLPFNWAIGLVVVAFLKRSLIKRKDTKRLI